MYTGIAEYTAIHAHVHWYCCGAHVTKYSGVCLNPYLFCHSKGGLEDRFITR